MEKVVNFKSNKAITLICSMLLVFMMSLAIGINADAAQKQLIKLSSGKEYTSYDITGDGKKDNLYMSNSSYKLTIDINDENYVLYWEDFIDNYYDGCVYKTNFYLYSLSNGSRYLGINVIGMYDDQMFNSIYKYTPGELIRSLDATKILNGPIAGMGSTSYPVKVSGNTITIKFNTGITSSGIYDFNVNYRPSGNKLKATEDKYKLTLKNKSNGSKSKTFKALKKFKTYKKVGSKKVSYTTKVGEKLKVVKICPKSKNAYVLLKRTSGKTGWVNFKKLSYKNVK